MGTVEIVARKRAAVKVSSLEQRLFPALHLVDCALVLGLQIERIRIDAVAKAGGKRAIVEYVAEVPFAAAAEYFRCLLYTSPSPRDS